MVKLLTGAPAPVEGTIDTVDMHTGGEPVRIVAAGYPRVHGATILEKRRYARANLDHLRKLLMFEPRGHHDMYGVLPVEPDLPEADLAVLFMHNEGYSTMCGHATIALGRYAVDAGIVPAAVPETIVNLQCPCGLVRVKVAVTANGQGFVTGAASFESVPSFAFALDRRADVPGIGRVPYDIGYGGAFYALVAASAIGLDLAETPLDVLVEAADRITKHVAATVPLEHPDDSDLAFLYGTILTDGGDGAAGRPSRNVCVFAEREVDRSPTGSGVSARIAVQCARGLPVGEKRDFESLTGAVFSARPVARGRIGAFEAVRVEVSGHAYYSGRSSFSVEAGDPLGGGFLLR